MGANHGIFTIPTSATATVNQIFVTSGTGQAIIGRIEKVVFTSTSWANGSVFLVDKTTGEIIYGAGNVSGTTPRVYYPRVFASTTGGVSLSGTSLGWDKPYVAGPIVASGLGLGSTTAGTTGRIDVYYSQ